MVEALLIRKKKRKKNLKTKGDPAHTFKHLHCLAWSCLWVKNAKTNSKKILPRGTFVCS